MEAIGKCSNTILRKLKEIENRYVSFGTEKERGNMRVIWFELNGYTRPAQQLLEAKAKTLSGGLFLYVNIN